MPARIPPVVIAQPEKQVHQRKDQHDGKNDMVEGANVVKEIPVGDGKEAKNKCKVEACRHGERVAEQEPKASRRYPTQSVMEQGTG